MNSTQSKTKSSKSKFAMKKSVKTMSESKKSVKTMSTKKSAEITNWNQWELTAGKILPVTENKTEEFVHMNRPFLVRLVVMICLIKVQQTPSTCVPILGRVILSIYLKGTSFRWVLKSEREFRVILLRVYHLSVRPYRIQVLY